MVMVGHLLDHGQFGTYAVFGFYVISGYLMTLIMHQSYGYTGVGRLRFLLNRALRLYPLYWLACLFSIGLIILLGNDAVSGFHRVIYLPTNATSIGENLSMWFIGFFPNKVAPRLVPPTWSITVELFFYLMICTGLSRSMQRVQVWLGASAAYYIFSFATAQNWGYRYFPVPAASLPFAIGSLVFFLRGYWRTQKLFRARLFAPEWLLILILINALSWAISKRFFEGTFYISLLVSSVLVLQLASGREWKWMSKKLDTFIGDLSYPIYLLHWPTGLLVSYTLFGKPIRDASANGLMNLAISLLLIFSISIVLVKLVDRPMQNLRAKVKHGALPQLPRASVK